jgi:hypothetical protein
VEPDLRVAGEPAAPGGRDVIGVVPQARARQDSRQHALLGDPGDGDGAAPISSSLVSPRMRSATSIAAIEGSSSRPSTRAWNRVSASVWLSGSPAWRRASASSLGTGGAVLTARLVMYMAWVLDRWDKEKARRERRACGLQVRTSESSPSMQASRVNRVSPPPKTNKGGALAHGPSIPIRVARVKRLMNPADETQSAQRPRPPS